MLAESHALHVEMEGEGPVVVWLHGFTGSARNWRPQLRFLRDRHRVVAFDQRGHARSGVSASGRYDLAAFVGDLEGVLDGLDRGTEPAVVGGLSLGAAVALAFAAARPERVRGLVLASLPASAGQGALGHGLEMARVLENEGSEVAGARFVRGPESGLDSAAARLVRQGFLEHDPLALAGILRGVIQELPELLGRRDLADRLSMPVLLVAGERDPGSLASIRSLAKGLPGARVEVVPGAGHVVNLEAASAFNEILGSFLGELEGETGTRR